MRKSTNRRPQKTLSEEADPHLMTVPTPQPKQEPWTANPVVEVH